MTTFEALQQEIHNVKVKLNRARSIEARNEIEELRLNATIDNYLEELKDLNECLALEVKRLSK
jgi:hypothetical protein